MDEWIKEYTMHTQWNIIQPWERRKSHPFATIWIYLENIMLSEISHTEKNNVCSNFSKKEVRHRNLEEWWLPGPWLQGAGGRGRDGKKLVRGYKSSVIQWISPGDLIYYDSNNYSRVTIVSKTVLYIWSC